jgi:hypothetical protein
MNPLKDIITRPKLGYFIRGEISGECTAVPCKEMSRMRQIGWRRSIIDGRSAIQTSQKEPAGSSGQLLGGSPAPDHAPLQVIESKEPVMDQGSGSRGGKPVTFPRLGSRPILFERRSFAPNGEGQVALPRSGCCSPCQLRHGRMAHKRHRPNA